MRTRVVQIVLVAILAAYFLLSIVMVADKTNADIPVKFQWDFRMAFFSTKAYFQNMNPYDRSQTSILAEEPVLEYF